MTRARLLLLGLLGLAACNGDTVAGNGDDVSRILLTDAPFPFDQVRSVDVYIERIDAARTFDTTATVDWTTIVTPDRSFNLLDLQDGQTALLGETDVRATEFAAIRLVVRTDRSGITLTDGTPATVDWMGPAVQMIHAAVEQPRASTDGTGRSSLVVDFDVGRSFLQVPGGDFRFAPWIRAVNESATGTVSGGVVGPVAQTGRLGPVVNASVVLYRSYNGSLTLAGTARTGPDGAFRIHYVSGGGPYRVEVVPPSGLAAAHGYSEDFTVTPGQTTNLGIVLEQGTGAGRDLVISTPPGLVVGGTISLSAFVFNESGDSVFGGGVTWQNGSPEVARLDGTGPSVQLTGLAAGATTVVARSDELIDSVVVTVSDPDAPVGSVEIVPSSVTLAVGDSTALRAILRDAAGNLLTDRPVSWSVDATMLSVLGSFDSYLIVRAAAPGVTTVVAASGGQQGMASVTVR